MGKFNSTRVLQKLICCLLLLLSLKAHGAAAGDFFLQSGDRVVFYGDSITEQAHYTLPVQVFVATKFPQLDVEFINSGWAGDRAWGGEGGMLAERLQRDVIRHQPTVVTVMLGMNDAYYTNYDNKALAAYRASLEELIKTLQAKLPSVRLTLIGSSPYDNVTPGEQPEWEQKISGGYNTVVRKFSEAAGEVAKRHNVLFVDMNQSLVDLLERMQKDEPTLARQLIPDRIHPGSAAGLVMAAKLLNAWDAPVEKSLVTFDARGRSTSLIVARERWQPSFPLDQQDPLISYLLNKSDAIKLFAPQKLRVARLQAEEALVEVNGNDLGKFTLAELERGIDVSQKDFEFNSQGERVAELIKLRNQIYFLKWRMLEVPSSKNSSQDERDRVHLLSVELEKIGNELARLRKEMAEPTWHLIEIRSQRRER